MAETTPSEVEAERLAVERERLVDVLEAARNWRSNLIEKTSTCTYPAALKLLEAISVFDRQPCDHPRSWRVFSSQLADADELCGYCGKSLVPATMIPYPQDPPDPDDD